MVCRTCLWELADWAEDWGQSPLSHWVQSWSHLSSILERQINPIYYTIAMFQPDRQNNELQYLLWSKGSCRPGRSHWGSSCCLAPTVASQALLWPKMNQTARRQIKSLTHLFNVVLEGLFALHLSSPQLPHPGKCMAMKDYSEFYFQLAHRLDRAQESAFVDQSLSQSCVPDSHISQLRRTHHRRTFQRYWEELKGKSVTQTL